MYRPAYQWAWKGLFKPIARLELIHNPFTFMEQVFRKRSACPCCNTLYSDKCKVINGILSEKTDPKDLPNGWVGLNRNSFFSYSRCTKCQTLAARVYPTEEILSQLYSQMPPNMEEAVSKLDQQRNQDHYARHIIRFLKGLGRESDPQSILELGADCGLLANAISRLANTSSYHYSAIEPNESVKTDLANALTQNYGSHELHLEIKEISKEHPSRLFDIIAAVHVFDHIFAIEDLIHSLKDMLSEEGFIFFVVHNPESTIAKVLGTRWPPFCAQHPQLFTISGVRALAERAGLKIVDHGRTLNHFPLRMIGSFMGISSARFQRLSIQAPLGNRFYILMNKGAA